MGLLAGAARNTDLQLRSSLRQENSVAQWDLAAALMRNSESKDISNFMILVPLRTRS